MYTANSLKNKIDILKEKFEYLDNLINKDIYKDEKIENVINIKYDDLYSLMTLGSLFSFCVLFGVYGTIYSIFFDLFNIEQSKESSLWIITISSILSLIPICIKIHRDNATSCIFTNQRLIIKKLFKNISIDYDYIVNIEYIEGEYFNEIKINHINGTYKLKNLSYNLYNDIKNKIKYNIKNIK